MTPYWLILPPTLQLICIRDRLGPPKSTLNGFANPKEAKPAAVTKTQEIQSNCFLIESVRILPNWRIYDVFSILKLSFWR